MGPAGEDSSGTGAPFRCGDANVLPTFEIQVDGRMVDQGGKGAFGGIEYGREVGAGLAKCVDFVMRVFNAANGDFGVAVSSSLKVLFG
jgi:hypothetical protein